MSPKEKANELFYKYYDRLEHKLSEDYSPHEVAVFKECVLLAVDEIIETLNHDIRDLDVRGNILLDLIRYWRSVREEVEKL